MRQPAWLVVISAVAGVGCSAAHELPAVPEAGAGDAAIEDGAAPFDAGPAPVDAFVAPVDAPVPTGVGAPCAHDIDCPSLDGLNPGYCISEGEGARAGYCTGPCMINENCGPDGRCAGAPSGSHAPVWPARCVRACGPTSCRPGYVCGTASTMGPGCFPDCRAFPGVCGGAR